jgi:hypothetical protein
MASTNCQELIQEQLVDVRAGLFCRIKRSVKKLWLVEDLMSSPSPASSRDPVLTVSPHVPNLMRLLKNSVSLFFYGTRVLSS